MKLYIDNREPTDVINIIKSRLQTTEVVLGNLEIGDFIIKNNNDEIVMIFERKAHADLMSSIKDGRYNEQSFRLAQVPIHNHNIFYIIEGNIMNFCLKKTETQQKTLFSAMLSISYKKGFSLLHTNNSLETAEFIIRFAEKFESDKACESLRYREKELTETCKKEPEAEEPIAEEVAYSSVVKIAKKANITKDNIGEIMLAQIPGLSITVAQDIMAQYKTINNLINVLTAEPGCLDKFQVSCKKGEKQGKKKIGKNVVEKIKEFLL